MLTFSLIYFTTGRLDQDIDIIFALGASDPNGVRIFGQEKALTNYLISQQKATTTRYGIITYSNTASTEIPMQSSTNIYRLQDQVRNLKWPGIGSGVDTALRQANSMFMNSKPGSRKVLVIFMSGRASAPSSTLRQAVRPLINQGVRVVLVGYGDNLDDSQLRGISENTNNVIFPRGQQDVDGYQISSAVYKGRVF
jgi:hypothetical protein